MMRVIMTGSIPADLFSAIAAAFGKFNKKALCLDGSHPISRRHGATMVLCQHDDPEMKPGSIVRTEVDDLKEQLHRALDDASRRAPVSVLAAVNDLAKSFQEERDLYAGRLAELQERHDRLRERCDRLAEMRERVLALEPPATFRESRVCGLSSEDAVTEESQAAWEMCRDAVLGLLELDGAEPVRYQCPECVGAGELVLSLDPTDTQECGLCEGAGQMTFHSLGEHYNALFRDFQATTSLWHQAMAECERLRAAP